MLSSNDIGSSTMYDVTGNTNLRVCSGPSPKWEFLVQGFCIAGKTRLGDAPGSRANL